PSGEPRRRRRLSRGRRSALRDYAPGLNCRSARPDANAGDSSRFSGLQLLQQPYLCEPPVPEYGVGRDAQHLGCFFRSQSAEVAQLNHSCFPRVKFGKRVERIIERNEVGPAPSRRKESLVKVHPAGLAAAFLV